MRSSRVGAPLELAARGVSTRTVSSGIEAMAAEAIRRVIESSCCKTYNANKSAGSEDGEERALRNRAVGDLEPAVDDRERFAQLLLGDAQRRVGEERVPADEGVEPFLRGRTCRARPSRPTCR